MYWLNGSLVFFMKYQYNHSVDDMNAFVFLPSKASCNNNRVHALIGNPMQSKDTTTFPDGYIHMRRNRCLHIAVCPSVHIVAHIAKVYGRGIPIDIKYKLEVYICI